MPMFQVGMPTCQTACKFSTWHANMQKSIPIFQTFLLWNAKGNSYTLLPRFILSTFLGLFHSKNTQSWIEFWSFFSKKKFFVQINQDFTVYMLKRKLAVFYCVYIFSCLTCMMKDEINSHVAFTEVKEVFTNTICCIK